MKAAKTINVYVGSSPVDGDIVIKCVKGQEIDPSALKAYRDQLVANGAINPSKPDKEKK